MFRKACKVRRSRSRRGFTLLEILLVVGLLALLATFAIPALIGQGEKAKINIVKAAIGPNGTLSQSIKMYKFNCGQYPEELKYLLEKPSDDAVASKWTGPYLEDAQGLIDPWSNEYMYNGQGTHNEGGFDLWSKGPDGQDGTDDDITNWKSDR